MKGEVDILGNFPIDTSLKKKALSGMMASPIRITMISGSKMKDIALLVPDSKKAVKMIL